MKHLPVDKHPYKLLVAYFNHDTMVLAVVALLVVAFLVLIFYAWWTLVLKMYIILRVT
jgi:hypothetical protein